MLSLYYRLKLKTIKCNHIHVKESIYSLIRTMLNPRNYRATQRLNHYLIAYQVIFLLELWIPDPDSDLPTFKLGETIRLEEMGPIIIMNIHIYSTFFNEILDDTQCSVSIFRGAADQM